MGERWILFAESFKKLLQYAHANYWPELSHMTSLLQEGCKMRSSSAVVTCPVEYSLTKEEEDMDNEGQSTAFPTPRVDTAHVTKFTLAEMPKPVVAGPSSFKTKTKTKTKNKKQTKKKTTVRLNLKREGVQKCVVNI